MEHSSSSDDVIMLSVSRTRLKTILVSHLHISLFLSRLNKKKRKKCHYETILTMHIALLFKLDKSITTGFVGIGIFDQANLNTINYNL